MKKFKFRLLLNLLLSLFFSSIITLVIYILIYYFTLGQLNPSPYIPYILIGIFLITTIIIFSSLLDYSLTYIDQLTKTINQIANGQFDIAIPIEHNDEFNHIAKHINQMARDLKESKEKEDYSNHKERIHQLALLEEEKKTHALITNVAHDLKTPLTSMMGYLQLLNDHPEFDQEKQQKYLKIVYDKGSRLQRLMNDLFHYSAFSSKQIQFNPQKINISELLMQMIEEYYSSFEKEQLLLQTNICSPNIYVNGDGELLARVFDNLINNAIKYHDNDKNIYFCVEEDDRSVTIRISNSSLPLTNQELEHIFEKFYRTDASRSSKSGGTGLGLAISKSIIEMHGGEIFATYRHGLLNMIVVLEKYKEK